MKSITRNSDGAILGYGLQVQYDADLGVRAVGRDDNAAYVGPWSCDGSTAASVTVADYTPPEVEAPAPWSELWVSKKPIPPHQFPVIVEGAGVSYGRIADDEAGAFVRDVILAPTMALIDPNDTGIAPDGEEGVFRWIIARLKATNGADDQPLLTDDGEAAIAALWPNKTA